MKMPGKGSGDIKITDDSFKGSGNLHYKQHQMHKIGSSKKPLMINKSSALSLQKDSLRDSQMKSGVKGKSVTIQEQASSDGTKEE